MITAADLTCLAELSSEIRRHLRGEPKEASSYRHMGATLTDTMLQAALSYCTVVRPRVDRLMTLWPSATTASRFLSKARQYGLSKVLDWRSPVKLERIRMLTAYCVDRGLETEDDLRLWFLRDPDTSDLMSLPGMGPKTHDYLRKLVGLSVIPVDRHMASFLESAGLECSSYEERQQALMAFASFLDISPEAFDDVIWRLQSDRRSANRDAAPLIKRSDYVSPATNPYRFRLEETTGWHRGKPAEASRGS